LTSAVVTDEDFLSESDANAMLASPHGRWPNVRLLASRGLVQWCYRASDGAEGITRDSATRELERRRTAGRWRRFTRAVGGIVHYL
jgi:hypothetical protein